MRDGFRSPGHEHWGPAWEHAAAAGPGDGRGAPAVLGVLLLLALGALVLGALLRRPRVRAWTGHRLRALRRRPGTAAVQAAPPPVDLDVLADYPSTVRARCAALLALVEELPRQVLPGPQRALHQHRADSLRESLRDLVHTLGRLPVDIAERPGPAGVPPLDEALTTLALLEAEAQRLRAEVHRDTVVRLQQQRSYATDKYGGATSVLDLS